MRFNFDETADDGGKKNTLNYGAEVNYKLK